MIHIGMSFTQDINFHSAVSSNLIRPRTANIPDSTSEYGALEANSGAEASIEEEDSTQGIRQVSAGPAWERRRRLAKEETALSSRDGRSPGDQEVPEEHSLANQEVALQSARAENNPRSLCKTR
jgi:hypothetical protein